MNTFPSRRFPNWRAIYWPVAACLLVMPAVAMQFTTEVNWGPADFLVMALLLALAGLAAEGVLRLVHGPWARLFSIAAVAAAFMLIWAQLAVGVF